MVEKYVLTLEGPNGQVFQYGITRQNLKRVLWIAGIGYVVYRLNK